MVNFIKLLLFSSAITTVAAYLKCAQPYNCLKISECRKLHGDSLQNFVFRYCGNNRFDEVCCPKFGNASESPIFEVKESTTAKNSPTTKNLSLEFETRKLLLPTETCGWGNVSFENKIFQGRNTEPGEFPWIVLLKIYEAKNTICGGTLISNRYVLTAAHCLYSYDHKKMRVTLGAADLEGKISCSYKNDRKPKTRKVDKVIVHEKYFKDRQRFGGKDIGLIRMNKIVKFDDCIQPACLPFDNFGKGLRRENSALLTAGWGTKGRSSSLAKILQITEQYFVNFTECGEKYKDQRYLIPILNSQICTLGPRNARGLKGDSGGPLLSCKFMRRGADPPGMRFILVGILSSGPQDWNRADAVPNIYTKVSTFLDWILQNIEK